jgi:PKD repeat protein
VHKSQVLTATGNKISIFFKWGATGSDAARHAYADDVSLQAFATGPSASHTYTTAGSYPLQLTVTDDKGATVVCTKTITVLASQPPVCNFTMSPSPTTINRPVTFTSTSTDPDGTVTGWAWTFGDGNTANVNPATHAYTAGGTYTVGLTVTDDTGVTASCSHDIDVATTVQVDIPLTITGWHMISLPLRPVDNNILLDPSTGQVDPSSIFANCLPNNDPRNRLFRIEPGVGYWTYNPSLYPAQRWYKIGEALAGAPDSGPWWQGFWFLVDSPVTISYTAYPPETESRLLDIHTAPGDWAWMMIGGCGNPPDPYNPDVTTWTGTSLITQTTFGRSAPPNPPATWIPTSDCAVPDAWDQGYIGLPLSGYNADPLNRGYYSVSPPQGQPYCGAPAPSSVLAAGEGFWFDIEDTQAWMKVVR